VLVKIFKFKMKLRLFLLVIFGIFAQSISDEGPEVKEEDNVLVLTDKNFDAVITANRHVLVEFCKCNTITFIKMTSSTKALTIL